MPDHTDDIDALLRLWSESARSDHRRYHRALTSLLAERNALKQRVAQFEAADTISAQRVSDLIADKLRLQQRVAELEAALKPSDRDLRERLVCAIWPEILRIFERTDTTHNNGANWDLVRINARDRALTEADAMIAEMRKVATDGK